MSVQQLFKSLKVCICHWQLCWRCKTGVSVCSVASHHRQTTRANCAFLLNEIIPVVSETHGLIWKSGPSWKHSTGFI